ncbi:MAG: Hpt domain-containing protein [Betaproteobacteria bacterium]|nr:Hpt domain-containing protein [Candidatus Dechloromonas phosphorivorans]
MKQADAEIIEIIAQVFLDTAPRDLQRLRDALNTGQIDELLRMAHTSRGHSPPLMPILPFNWRLKSSLDAKRAICLSS